jgi:hypothetical protein
MTEELNVTKMRAIAAIDIAERAVAIAKRVAWIAALALILAIVRGGSPLGHLSFHLGYQRWKSCGLGGPGPLTKSNDFPVPCSLNVLDLRPTILYLGL